MSQDGLVTPNKHAKSDNLDQVPGASQPIQVDINNNRRLQRVFKLLTNMRNQQSNMTTQIAKLEANNQQLEVERQTLDQITAELTTEKQELASEKDRLEKLLADSASNQDVSEQVQKLRQEKEQLVRKLIAEKEHDVMMLIQQREQEIERLKTEKEQELEQLRLEKEQELQRIKIEKEQELQRIKIEKEQELQRIKTEKEKEAHQIKTEKEQEVERLKIEKNQIIEDLYNAASEKDKMAVLLVQQRQQSEQQVKQVTMQLQKEKDIEVQKVKVEKDAEVQKAKDEKVQEKQLLQDKKDAEIQKQMMDKDNLYRQLADQKVKSILDRQTLTQQIKRMAVRHDADQPMVANHALGLRTRPISLRAITWNVGNTAPASLDPLLAEASENLVVFAVQECVWNTKDSGQKFCQAASESLGNIYYHVASSNIIESGHGNVLERMDFTKTGGLRIMLFAQRQLRPFIQDIDTLNKNTGAGQVWHNKGGVAISLKLFNTTLIFVGCHLAAHQDEVSSRNKDVIQITKSMAEADTMLSQYDYCFWMGDLNYRIDLPREQVLEMIDFQNWAALQEHDQLIKERVKLPGYPLSDFEEMAPNFAPTFKRNRMAPGYETKKLRIPSWCDRVLYHSRPGLKISPLSYQAIEEVQTSDHRPVMFTCDMLSVLPYLPTCEQHLCRITLSDIQINSLMDLDGNGVIDSEQKNEEVRQNYNAPQVGKNVIGEVYDEIVLLSDRANIVKQFHTVESPHDDEDISSQSYQRSLSSVSITSSENISSQYSTPRTSRSPRSPRTPRTPNSKDKKSKKEQKIQKKIEKKVKKTEKLRKKMEEEKEKASKKVIKKNKLKNRAESQQIELTLEVETETDEVVATNSEYNTTTDANIEVPVADKLKDYNTTSEKIKKVKKSKDSKPKKSGKKTKDKKQKIKKHHIDKKSKKVSNVVYKDIADNRIRRHMTYYTEPPYLRADGPFLEEQVFVRAGDQKIRHKAHGADSDQEDNGSSDEDEYFSDTDSESEDFNSEYSRLWRISEGGNRDFKQPESESSKNDWTEIGILDPIKTAVKDVSIVGKHVSNSSKNVLIMKDGHYLPDLKWANNIYIYPYITDRQYLATQRIILTISSHIRKKRGKQLQAQIGLQSAIQQAGRSIEFTAVLSSHDSERYEIKGTIIVEYKDLV